MDLDRLSRQPRQIEDWIDLAEDEHRYLVTCNENIDLRTETGKTYARIKAAVQRQEVQQMKVRSKRNALARAEAGRWHGGRVPFGYRSSDRKLIPYAPEVKLIQEAARRLLDDREPLNSICQSWNTFIEDEFCPINSEGKKGYRISKPTQSGFHWRSINLRKILLNRTLLGETRAGVVGWTPVIDQRTFDRVTALLMEPGRRKNLTTKMPGGRMALGGGLTVCGGCGKALTLVSRMYADGKVVERLSCRKSANGPDPDHHRIEARIRTVRGVEREEWHETGRVTVNHNDLEEHVWGLVIARLDASPRWHERMSEADPNVNTRIDALQRERMGLQDERDSVKRAFIAGIIDNESEALKEYARIDAELGAIERKIGDLLGAPLLAETFNDGFDWRIWAPGKRRTALKGFIDRVIVNEATAVSRVSPPFRGETPDAYEERRREAVRNGMTARVRIKWRDGLRIRWPSGSFGSPAGSA